MSRRGLKVPGGGGGVESDFSVQRRPKLNNIIKILGLMKSFAFVMWCICGASYQKWIDQANKRLFYPYGVSKKYKKPIFWPKIEI